MKRSVSFHNVGRLVYLEREMNSNQLDETIFPHSSTSTTADFSTDELTSDEDDNRNDVLESTRQEQVHF